MSTDAIRARRTLRIVTTIVIALAAASTHIPKLSLGSDANPSPDKSEHMLLFAILTAGAWYSGWFRSLGILWLVGAAWAALDEWTQGIPALGRAPDMEDWAADMLGVTLAVAWIKATRPLGGPESRRRRAARDASYASIFARRWPWLAVLGGALLGACASLPFFLFVGERSWAMSQRQVVITGVAVVGIAAAYATIETLLRLVARPPYAPLPDRLLMRLIAGPALAAFALLILLTAVSQLALVLRPIVSPAAVAYDWFRQRSPTLRSAVDLGGILLLAAWACHRARRNVAARVDRAHLECVRCGHSLTGLGVTKGAGRCPECGAEFLVPAASDPSKNAPAPGTGADHAAP